MRAHPCSWCGVTVEPADGFRVYAPAGERRVVFCRLEHVVAWALRDAHWEASEPDEVTEVDEAVTHCAWCEAGLTDTHVLLVRARGDHRIPDGFCGVDHLLEWAKAGGRWAVPR